MNGNGRLSVYSHGHMIVLDQGKDLGSKTKPNEVSREHPPKDGFRSKYFGHISQLCGYKNAL